MRCLISRVQVTTISKFCMDWGSGPPQHVKCGKVDHSKLCSQSEQKQNFSHRNQDELTGNVTTKENWIYLQLRYSSQPISTLQTNWKIILTLNSRKHILSSFPSDPLKWFNCCLVVKAPSSRIIISYNVFRIQRNT